MPSHVATDYGSKPNARHHALMSILNPLTVHIRLPRDDVPANGAISAKMMKKQPHTSGDSSGEDGDGNDGAQSATSDSSSATSRQHKRDHAELVQAPRSGAQKKKLRKPTYAVRKEEKQLLLDELQTLQARVKLLRERIGIPTSTEHETLDAAQKDNCTMQRARRTQAVALCGVQSTIAQHLRDQFASPLKMPIQLCKDPLQRQATLIRLRREKLDLSYRFIGERLRGVDDRLPLDVEESWTSRVGNFCFHRMDILHFEGVRSVKQVFDACALYMVNMEISISENLGQLTLREDFDAMDPEISNYRLISTIGHGIAIESNSVGFGEYYEHFEAHDGQEFGLFTTDCVDDDELYPYCPQSRVRRDCTAAISITSYRKPIVVAAKKKRAVESWLHGDKEEQEGQEGQEPLGELVVVLRRCAYLMVHKPQFEVSQETLDELRGNVVSWGRVMAKVIRENVYAPPPPPPHT